MQNAAVSAAGQKKKVVLASPGRISTMLHLKRLQEPICTPYLSRLLYHRVSVLTLTWRHRLTMHNVHYLLSLMGEVRAAIIEDRYPEFLRSYFRRAYGAMQKIPTWATTALRNVGVDLLA